jgi:hypothetical protein
LSTLPNLAHSLVHSILANDNPTLLEINMVADLTARKMDQLRQTQELPADVYGALFYTANDCAEQRAGGRIFGLWQAMGRFWAIYDAAQPKPVDPAKANGPAIIIDSLSGLGAAVVKAAASKPRRAYRRATNKPKTKGHK